MLLRYKTCASLQVLHSRRFYVLCSVLSTFYLIYHAFIGLCFRLQGGNTTTYYGLLWYLSGGSWAVSIWGGPLVVQCVLLLNYSRIRTITEGTSAVRSGRGEGVVNRIGLSKRAEGNTGLQVALVF